MVSRWAVVSICSLAMDGWRLTTVHSAGADVDADAAAGRMILRSLVAESAEGGWQGGQPC